MVLLVLEDVTERKREEERSRQLAQEQIARVEAERANRKKDEFLAMLAHELRNPLSPMLNALLILRSPQVESGDLDWALAIMERQVRHMARLIDDLLDVSRVMRGVIQLRARADRPGPAAPPRHRRRPAVPRGASPRADRRGARGTDHAGRRPGPARAGLHEPAEQRGQVHARRRPDRADGRPSRVARRSSGSGTTASASPRSSSTRSSSCSCRPTARSTARSAGSGSA